MVINQKKGILNCRIKNVMFSFNYYDSKLVGKVTNTFISDKGIAIPRMYKPNSVSKKIINCYVVTERNYNNKGEAYIDIDYTCHGNPKIHSYVPHIHKLVKDEAGKLIRGKWEVFQ